MILFDAFLGRWHFDRHIEDRLAGHVLRGTGEAQFTSTGKGQMRYDETVLLEVPGQGPMSGTRRYLWDARGHAIDIRFDDGRPFHAVDLEAAASKDTHRCDPDLYRVTYVFGTWPLWSARWEVTGPTKSYVMETAFRRP